MERNQIGRRSPSSGSRSQSSNPIVVYERCIKNYQRDIQALHDQIHELQNRLKANESPDSVLIQTCTNLQDESQRLSEEIVNLRNRNVELSNKIANDSTFECLEQNKKLNNALLEANRREETLIEKCKRSSYKFKELKNQFDNTTSRYKELIREKKESDEKQIELIKANQNLENIIKNRDIDLQKHKDSLSKVMKHYLDTKAKKQETEKKLKESIDQNNKTNEKLEEKQKDVERHKETISSKEKEIKNLKDEVEQNKNDFQELQEKMNQIEEEKQRLLNVETELVESRENNDHLVTQLKSLESENLAISQQIIELKENLNIKRDSLRDAKKKISDLNNELDQVYNDKTQLEETVHHYQVELNAANNEKKELGIKIQKEEKEIDHLNDEVEELKNQNDQLTNEIERLKPFESDCAQYLLTIESLQKEKEEVHSNNINLNDANIELRRKNHQMKEKLNGLKIENSELQMEYDKLLKEDNDLKDEYNNVIKDNQTLRNLNDKYKNDITTMNTQINTLNAQLKDINSQYSILLTNFTHLKEKETEQEEDKAKIVQTMNAKLDELKKQNKDITELLNRSQKQVAENREMADKLSKDYDKLSKQYVKLLQLNHSDSLNNSGNDEKLNKSYIGNYKRSKYFSANTSPTRRHANNNYNNNNNKNYSFSSFQTMSQIHSRSRSPSPTRSPIPSPSPIRSRYTVNDDLIKSLSARVQDLQNENEKLRDQLELAQNNEQQSEDEENRYNNLLDSFNESKQENELLRDEIDRLKSASLHNIDSVDPESSEIDSTITNESMEDDSILNEMFNNRKKSKDKIAQLEEENRYLQDQLNLSNKEINENSLINSKKLSELQKKVDDLNHQLIASPDRKKFDDTEKERNQLREENNSLKRTVHALQFQLKGMENTPLLNDYNETNEQSRSKSSKSPNQRSNNSSFQFNEDNDRNNQVFPKRKPSTPTNNNRRNQIEIIDEEVVIKEDDDDFYTVNTNKNGFSRSAQIKNQFPRKTDSKSPATTTSTRVNKNNSISPKLNVKDRFSSSLPINENKQKNNNNSLSPGKKIIIAKNRKDDKLVYHEVEFGSENEVNNVVRIHTKVGKGRGAQELYDVNQNDLITNELDENEEDDEIENITSEEIESINKMIKLSEKLVLSDSNNDNKGRKKTMQQDVEDEDTDASSEQVNREILNQYTNRMSPPPHPGNVFKKYKENQNDLDDHHTTSSSMENNVNDVIVSEEEEVEEGSEEGELRDQAVLYSRDNYQKLTDNSEEEEDNQNYDLLDE